MNVLEQAKTTSPIASNNGFNIRKIIVAVDLSPHSIKTAFYAAEFAKSLGASVTLLHVFAPEPSTEFATEQLYESFEQGRRLMVWKLTKLLETVRQTGVKCDHDFRVGDPAEQVVRAAQDLQADLIVVANHHPGFLGRFFGLDHAPRIVHRASCPVLIYREVNE